MQCTYAYYYCMQDERGYSALTVACLGGFVDMYSQVAARARGNC